jgi:hypothetical protein
MGLVTVRHMGAPWDRPRGEPQFLAIALTDAEKAVVGCVGLHMVIVRIGDAAE